MSKYNHSLFLEKIPKKLNPQNKMKIGFGIVWKHIQTELYFFIVSVALMNLL